VEDRQAVAGQEPQAPAAPPAPKTSWTDAEVAEILTKMAVAELDKAVGAYDWMGSKGLVKRAVGEGGRTATDIIALRMTDVALHPAATVAEIADIRNKAADRGLLKVKVSETETLEQALHEARDLAAHEAAAAKGEPSSPIESPTDIRGESD
jgi:hypothetical protein